MNPLNGGHTACNLVSNATMRYAAWYTEAEEVMVGKQALNVGGAPGPWTIVSTQLPGTTLNANIGLIPLAARTALALPCQFDTHCWIAIALMGDGKLIVWANMHDNPVRMISCADPINAFAVWVNANATLPGSVAANSYPIPIHHPDGSVRLYMRDSAAPSGAGRCDAHFWDAAPGTSAFGVAPALVGRQNLFKGLSVVNGRGPGLIGDDNTGAPSNPGAGDTQFNWNPYVSYPYVEDLGGGAYKEHWFWFWRRDAVDVDPLRSNILPSYMNFDSRDGLWRSITGVIQGLPIDPINDLTCQTGLVGPANAAQPTSGNYTNGSSICLDDAGNPHILCSHFPKFHIWWDGAAWNQEKFGVNVAGGVFGVINCHIGTDSLNSIPTIFWKDGRMWIIGGGGPIAGGGDAQKQVFLWRCNAATGTGSITNVDATRICLASYAPTAQEAVARGIAFGFTHQALMDQEAFRLRGTVEVLMPYGDEPHVVVFGNNMKKKVSA